MDDLDIAEVWLSDGKPDHAMAYIQLWYAKQHREYREAVARQRQAQQNMPVPVPPIPFEGFYRARAADSFRGILLCTCPPGGYDPRCPTCGKTED